MATYDENVANYRQTVLAVSEVGTIWRPCASSNRRPQSGRGGEIRARIADDHAQPARAGTACYLAVVVAQASNERTAPTILGRR
jgi:hypothetical protein